MKILSYGLAISVTALLSPMASASIASWVSNTDQNTPLQERVKEQPAQGSTVVDTNSTTPSEQSAVNPEFSKPNRINTTSHVNTSSIGAPLKSTIQSTVPTDDTASKHLAQTSAFINNPSISSLKSEEYLAIVILNSALVQAGLDVKLNTNNQTTKNIFNNAVGCINSKKSDSLNMVAKKLISDHSKIVDIKDFVKSSPSIGSTFNANCM